MNIPISLQYSNPFYISQLHNGITICTEYISHSLLNCIGVYVNSGSRFESPNASGSAHFLEHILFKGTRHQTKTQFEYDIEQRGSSINAYTSREHTLYSIDCFSNEVKHSLQTLSHMIMYPTISSRAIENEKETITEELIHCYKDKIQLLMEMGHSCIYGKNTAMGRPILGDVTNIHKVNHSMVNRFYKRQYIGKNIFIVSCGNTPHDVVVNYSKEYFSQMQKECNIGSDKYENDFCKKKPMFIHNNKLILDTKERDGSCKGVGVFYPATNWFHRDYYVFLLIERMLSESGMNLNLNSKVFFNPYRDCGLFGMVVVGNDKEIVGKEVMKKVFPFNYAVGVSDYELNKAKNKLYMDLLNIHTANDLMYLIGPQMVYFGRRVSSKEIAENVNKVTKEDIYRVMRKWFVNGRPSFVGCGNKRKINEIINHFIQYKHSLNVKL